MNRSVVFQWIGAGCLAALLYVGYGMLQPRLTLQDGLAWDATLYHDVAVQMRADADPVTGDRPFVYRLGAPFLAAHAPFEDLRTSFLAVNLLFSLGTFFLLFSLLRAMRLSGWVVAVVLLLFGTNPAVIRFTFYYPVHTEPGAICLSLGLLVLAVRRPDWGWGETLAATLLSGVAVMFREFAVLAPLAVLGAECLSFVVGPRRWRQVGLRLVPVLGAVLAVWVSHQLVSVRPTPYSFTHAIQWSINENLTKPDQFLLAIVMTTGPVLFLPLTLFRHFRPWAGRADLILMLYSAGILVLAFVGGWHTDRFVSWGLIAMLPLIGRVLDRVVREGRPRWGVALILVPLLCAQVLAHKVLAPTPDTSSWDLVAPQDKAFVEHMWFTPYGENISPFHTQAVGLGPLLRPWVGRQYLVLLVYCSAVSAGLWMGERQRRTGP